MLTTARFRRQGWRSGARSRATALLLRALNSRYDKLPQAFCERPIRILDPGCGPKDAFKARRLFPECWYEGINIAPPPENEAHRAAFDRYHVANLDHTDLDFIADGSYDAIFCSHTIEHLEDGLGLVRRLCDKLRPGGIVYLEWPSVESQRFPLRGFGLNFFDDGTHRRTFTREEVAEAVTAAGCEVEEVVVRRQLLRILLAAPLIVYHSVRVRRLVLFDLWDVTGFCYVLRATKAAQLVHTVPSRSRFGRD